MKHEVDSVFLFVAEITGSFTPGTGNREDKIDCGKHDYIKYNLPNLDLKNEEHRKTLHEVIWLKRLYSELDTYFCLPDSVDNTGRYLALEERKYRPSSYKWTVAIEVDASALV